MRRIMKRLRDLLEAGIGLRGECPGFSVTIPGPEDQPGLTFQRRAQKWAMDCSAVLRFCQLTQSAACFGDPATGYGNISIFDTRLAVLESAISQIQGGFVGNIRHLLHADIFDSMIGQAAALLTQGHKVPAAVLGRIVIERWLRDRAEAVAIPAYDTAKPSKLNDDLKKSGEYSAPKWRQLQAYLDVGNAAAHGKPDEFSEDDVRQLLEYARMNCL